MIPEERISTETVEAEFLYPRNIRLDDSNMLVDYEYGGVAITDASQGLRVQVWTARLVEGQILLSAPSVPEFAALNIGTDPEVINIGFAFDHNMRLFATWENEDSECFYYYYDPIIGDFVTEQLSGGARTPRCCHDDTRQPMTFFGISDIVLAYCRGQRLMARVERDRYTIEYDLGRVGPRSLVQIGMNAAQRLQFRML